MEPKKPHQWIFDLVLVTFLLAGCTGAPSQPTAITAPIISPSAGEIVSLQQAGDILYADPDVKTKIGENEIGLGPSGTLPNGLPKDVPVYSGDRSTLNWQIVQKTGDPIRAFNLSITASIDASTALDQYKSMLISNGWKVGAQSADPNNPKKGILFTATKDTRVIHVTITNNSDSPPRTNISFVINI
jgi:hypothetical protein